MAYFLVEGQEARKKNDCGGGGGSGGGGGGRGRGAQQQG